MAKTKQHQPAERAGKKPTATTPSAGFLSSPFARNFIIIAALSVIFMGIYALNDERKELPDLYNELSTLRDRPGDHDQRIDEIQHRINEIETDTGWFKTLFVGYFDEIHFVAFGVNDQLDKVTAEMQNGSSAPLTREDKLAYKVHTYKLLDFLNANCKPNSVILLPPEDSLKNDSRWNFIYDPEWVEYFIYPRLCVETGREDLTPGLAKRVTHVLIIKGIGYDKLKYEVPLDKREPICLLPIDKPADAPVVADTTNNTN